MQQCSTLYQHAAISVERDCIAGFNMLQIHIMQVLLFSTSIYIFCFNMYQCHKFCSYRFSITHFSPHAVFPLMDRLLPHVPASRADFCKKRCQNEGFEIFLPVAPVIVSHVTSLP